MPKRLKPNAIKRQVPVAEREAMLVLQPCFAALTQREIRALAALFTETTVLAGSAIVREDSLVDSIYLVVEGIVEVRAGVTTANPEGVALLAVLRAGEAIGLNKTGFYSTTGKRTATVVALSDVLLLQLTVPHFDQFLLEHPHIKEVMDNNVEPMLRMNFIKQAAPFANLSVERLTWLAEHVTELVVEPGNFIFQQGERGHSCYLIYAGQVAIFSQDPDGSRHPLATLTAPSIFGETALLLDTPRNASAQAVTTCRLLEVSHELLQQVMQKEATAAAALMVIMRSRSRPLRMDAIEVHPQQTAEGQQILTLKDPQRGKYFRLSPEGWFLWQLLDGKQSLKDLTLAFFREYKIFDPGLVSQFVMELEHAGFIQVIGDKPSSEMQNLSRWAKVGLWIRCTMEASVALNNVDDWLTKTYARGIHYLFTWPAQLVFAVLAIAGLGAFTWGFHSSVELLRTTNHAWLLLVTAIPFSMATAFLHELGHAYATKYFGYKVRSFGVGWFWVGPVAFCDTSDMWLSTRWQRLAVDSIGLYINIIIAGLASILAITLTHIHFSIFLWLFALFNYLTVFANLNPMMELDGYFIAMDLFDKPNLREGAIHWLLHDFPELMRKPWQLFKSWIEPTYWLICLVYTIFEALIPYGLMNYFLYGFMGIQNRYISLILPFIVVTLSCLGIWSQVHQRKTAERAAQQSGHI